MFRIRSRVMRPFFRRIVAAFCLAAAAFTVGVAVGVGMVERTLQHFLDDHAHHQPFEEEFPNHNIPYHPGSKMLAVVGDSISASRYPPHAADAEYPFLLAKATHSSLLNLAVPGWETDAMIAHSVPAIPRNADSVIYEGGVNDVIYSGPRALTRIDRVVSAIRAQAPQAKIVIVGLRNFRQSLDPSIRAWNGHERDVAASIGATYVDLYSVFPPSDRAEWPDGVHPNEKGAQRVAKLVEESLKGTGTF